MVQRRKYHNNRCLRKVRRYFRSANTFFRFKLPKGLIPAQHDLRIRRQFPSFRLSHSSQGVFWCGNLQPQSGGPIYRIRIEWHGRKPPLVFVESPALQAGAPHRYAGGSLCLFFPGDLSWTPRIHIADSILPWAAEWLLFYEIWLFTKKWYGPEAPHNRGAKRLD